ncbi:hypothetical protein DB30_06521 [Enhygromyxa salina]|uniref:Uncharacterized protein n=2 Tax=Enhygromyxa salina TaxID=215803 RepID=A0A0C2D3C3_9BACT|nr:hypothetical protein DB30_06521 [Enhygromyxa salina]
MLCVSLVSACAATDTPNPSDKTKADSAKSSGEVGDGGEQAPAKLAVKLAVASVQVIQDCPDPPEPAPSGAAHDSPPPTEPMPAQPPAAGARADPGAAARKAGPGFQQPCTQSTMQLTLAVDGDAPQTVRIAAVRLLDKQGKVVGTLGSRKPSAWVDQGYAPWDETVGKGEVKASYKLSLPDWNAVDTAIGQSSFGYMFKLEVDVEIAGEIHTVQSPEFPREEPHVIVT